jgi:UDP:flavonoid glycosyltransferase YjiC (YdhE family)
MAQQSVEIIFLGDFREPVFRSMTADRIQAVVAAGYRTGIMQLAAGQRRRPARIHEDIRALIERGALVHLDPDLVAACRLLIVTDPRHLARVPIRSLRIDAPLSVVLVPHGPDLANGEPYYDWAAVHANARDLLSGTIVWAPTTPAVREQLSHLDPRPSLSVADWHPCIDPERWPSTRIGFCGPRPVIGRSGPPVEDAWPTDASRILSLYPDDPQFRVRILDGGPILKSLVGPFPRNWDVLLSQRESEAAFLASIDFFVYSHHQDFVTPVDPHLLRAMSAGVVAILPPRFERIFGDGAVYAEDHEIPSTVRQLYNDPARYLDVSRAGIRTIECSFGQQQAVRRIADAIGAPDRRADRRDAARRSGAVATQRSRRRVMFITINGVGMGHLTRMLAIAKRCPAPIEPVFVTMSQALKVLREQGYLAEFIPSRQYLDCDINQWNRFLCDELNEMISFYDPAVVVFDGNVPYQGIVDALQANPDPWSIWSRRGMWRATNDDIVEREKFFDVVVEPGDLAASDDHGITRRHQERTHHVSPIRLLDSADMLSRDEARRALGMDGERPAVLIQLGAGNNFDYRSIHTTALAHVQQRYDAQIAVGEWLISEQRMDLPDQVVSLPGYPFARYFKAFDLAISAVGYNSFHELLFAGIPTIFVPNENMSQDNQFARALFADRHGLAVCVRSKEVYKLTATIDRLFDPDERAQLETRMAVLDQANGAADAAALIDELAYTRRVGRL